MNNKQQQQNLQKRNRRQTRANANKGGSSKRTKHNRTLLQIPSIHAMGGLKAIGANPEYHPPHKKLKGYQLDHRGRKVA